MRRRRQRPREEIVDELVRRLPSEHAAFAELGGKCEVFVVIRIYRRKRNTQQYFVRLPEGEWTRFGRPYVAGNIPMKIDAALKALGWPYRGHKVVKGDADVEFPE